MKNLTILSLFISFLLIGSSTVHSQSLHSKMFESFTSLESFMNKPLLDDYINKTPELDEKYHALLDETMTDRTKLIPLGKVKKGKNMILLYIEAEYDKNGKLEIYYIHAATLKIKTGEKTTSEKYLLTAGKRNEMSYNGSFSLKPNDIIIFSQNEVNIETNEESVTVKEYKFAKELEYIKTH